MTDIPVGKQIEYVETMASLASGSPSSMPQKCDLCGPLVWDNTKKVLWRWDEIKQKWIKYAEVKK